MANVTTGLFKNSAAAAHAVRQLEAAGFLTDDISMIASNDFDRSGFKREPLSKATEGFAIGAAGGGAVGGLLAGLTAVTAIATGGAGLGLVVAGPLFATLIGAGAGAAAGSTVGGMIGAAIPDHDARIFEEAIRSGSVLIAVQTPDAESKKRAKDLMERAQSEKISGASSEQAALKDVASNR